MTVSWVSRPQVWGYPDDRGCCYASDGIADICGKPIRYVAESAHWGEWKFYVCAAHGAWLRQQDYLTSLRDYKGTP